MKQPTTAVLLIGIILSAVLTQCNSTKSAPNKKPNILFIAVDDLRPELACYGQKQVHSPHIDQIAGEGTLFTRAYCNIPVCGASRASILTGTRPTRHRFTSYKTWAEKDNPEAITLPQHFRNNGYYTISNGKVFHHTTDSEDSWDEIWHPEGHIRDYQTKENVALLESGKRGYPFERADVHDTAYFDGKVASKAIADLESLKEKDEPFFLALGFFKPHLPFNAPKKYWDMYSQDKIELPMTYQDSAHAPGAAFHNFGELRNYYGVPAEGPVTDSMAIALIHGYYASTSYVDAQIGRVLQALKKLGLKENTIVVLWGDHGYNLGEHGLWCKHCNFNTSLQSPLLISGAGIPKGREVNRLVEFVDIFPTLSELADLPQLSEQWEGASMLPIIKDANAPWDDLIVSKYENGLSIKKDHYIYTEWSASDSAVYARMLFDHEADPMEQHNIAEDPANQHLIKELKEDLLRYRGTDYNKPLTKEANH